MRIAAVRSGFLPSQPWSLDVTGCHASRVVRVCGNLWAASSCRTRGAAGHVPRVSDRLDRHCARSSREPSHLRHRCQCCTAIEGSSSGTPGRSLSKSTHAVEKRADPGRGGRALPADTSHAREGRQFGEVTFVKPRRFSELQFAIASSSLARPEGSVSGSLSRVQWCVRSGAWRKSRSTTRSQDGLLRRRGAEARHP